MKTDFDLKGIWKGEYVIDEQFNKTIIEIPPASFILKIKSLDYTSGLFEGMCQDHTANGRAFPHATIYGRWKENEISFTKKYPSLLVSDGFDGIVLGEESHPDIFYQGSLRENEHLLGAWSLPGTFRKIHNKIIEIRPIHGIWWMKKF